MGFGAVSLRPGRFLFAYVEHHWIDLDHDQTLSGSFGTSYHWSGARGGTRLYADVLFGTGLRTDATAPDGSTIPNGGSVPSYATLNVGAERVSTSPAAAGGKVRVDVINLTDKSYETARRHEASGSTPRSTACAAVSSAP